MNLRLIVTGAAAGLILMACGSSPTATAVPAPEPTAVPVTAAPQTPTPPPAPAEEIAEPPPAPTEEAQITWGDIEDAVEKWAADNEVLVMDTLADKLGGQLPAVLAPPIRCGRILSHNTVFPQPARF